MRSLLSQTKALLASGRFSLTVIARLVLPSGTYGASDSNDNFTFGGQAYAGFDRAFTAEVDPFTADGRGQGGRLKLSATDPALLATFQAEAYRAQPASVGLLVIDPATGLGVEEIPVLAAKLDTASIDEGVLKREEPETPSFSTLTVELTPAAVDLERAGVRVRSDEDQRTFRDSNDGFFKDVRQLGDVEIHWGNAGPSSPGQAGAASGRPGSGGSGGGQTFMGLRIA